MRKDAYNMTTQGEEVDARALTPLPKTKRGASELTTATSHHTSDDEGDEELFPQQVEVEYEEEAEDKEEAAGIKPRRRRHRNRRILIGVCLAAIIVFVIVDSTTRMYCKSAVESLLQWVEENPAAGIIAFTLFVFVATVAFIPGAILTIGAGFVFERTWGLGTGILVGTITVFVGASAGAIVSFLIGRYLLRDFVDHLAHRYSIFEALDAVMKENGFRIMALLRLSPIIPFNAINYISGVTSISLLSYSLANIAIIPGTVLFVFVGASAGCIANDMGNGATATIVAIVVGVVFAIFAILLTSYYARRELNRIIASREAEEGDLDAAPESAPQQSQQNSPLDEDGI
jgi:uncharacterized membrane protein YdjX (TVP38/TMEM64 family)